MLNINDDLVKDIVDNRPYVSPKDFLNKVKPKKQAMVSLIKGGAFDSMMDRKLCMGWYLWEICDKKKRLTLQNMRSLIENNIFPLDLSLSQRVYEFNRYLKEVCKHNKSSYKLDDRAVNFLMEIEEDSLIEQDLTLNISQWEKCVYQKHMDNVRAWLTKNQETALRQINVLMFKKEWDKYAQGNLSAWEMEVLCFYYHEHELLNINNYKYGISNFKEIPNEPEVEKTFVTKTGKTINMFKLYKICGTCIAKNKTKSIVTLLTPTGVVNVKFRKEYFSLFDKQISEKQSDGVKKVIEKSFFNRGNMIVVQGIRSGDDFLAKNYKASNSHTLYKIEEITPEGDVVLRSQRYGEE